MIPRWFKSQSTFLSSSGGRDDGKDLDLGRKRCSISSSFTRAANCNCSKLGMKGFGGFGLKYRNRSTKM